MGFDKRSAFCYLKHSMPRSPRTHSMKTDVKLPQSSLLPFARPLRWPSQAVPPPHSTGYITFFLSQCNAENESFNHSHHDETALKISSKSACNVRNSGGGGAGVEGGEL